MSDSTPEDLKAKLGVDPAIRVGGMRVGNHHPHHHSSKTSSEEEEKRIKDREDANAYALSAQVAELDAVHQGSVQQELASSQASKAVPSQYYPPHKEAFQRGPTRGNEVRRQNHSMQEPSGKNGHNNYGH